MTLTQVWCRKIGLVPSLFVPLSFLMALLLFEHVFGVKGSSWTTSILHSLTCWYGSLVA